MKKVFALFIILVFGCTLNLNAQVVAKKLKNGEIVYKKDVEKPTTNANWAWVSGEWVWKKKSKKYKWVKAHWAKAPKGKKYWQKGHWKKVKKGWEWSSGYWK